MAKYVRIVEAPGRSVGLEIWPSQEVGYTFEGEIHNNEYIVEQNEERGPIYHLISSVEEVKEDTKPEFDIEKFKKVRENMVKAEDFIIDEGAKMGIDLTREQARIFANAVLMADDTIRNRK